MDFKAPLIVLGLTTERNGIDSTAILTKGMSCSLYEICIWKLYGLTIGGQKFFGFIPLYAGVEIVLSISILNKISGVYGMLALFTGHPLDFFQCLYYLSSALVAPFYINMMANLSITLPSSPMRFKTSTLSKVSFCTVLYTIDTMISTLFTVYFSWFWFSGTAEAQDSHVAQDIAESFGSRAAADVAEYREMIAEPALQYIKRDVVDHALDVVARNAKSESASTSYEMFFTVASIIAVTVIRFYFNAIIISFARTLIKAAKYNSTTEAEDDDEFMRTEFLNGNVFKRKLRQLELRACFFLKNVFS